MKLIIDIDKEMYDDISDEYICQEYADDILNSVKNSTPLDQITDEIKMTRCDCCEYRNSYDCGDGWNRVSNNRLCENFKLDFSRLSYGKQIELQKMFLEEDDFMWD